MKTDFADFVFTVYNFSKQKEEVCHSSSLNIDQELMFIKFGKIYLKQFVKIDQDKSGTFVRFEGRKAGGV